MSSSCGSFLTTMKENRIRILAVFDIILVTLLIHSLLAFDHVTVTNTHTRIILLAIPFIAHVLQNVLGLYLFWAAGAGTAERSKHSALMTWPWLITTTIFIIGIAMLNFFFTNGEEVDVYGIISIFVLILFKLFEMLVAYKFMGEKNRNPNNQTGEGQSSTREEGINSNDNDQAGEAISLMREEETNSNEIEQAREGEEGEETAAGIELRVLNPTQQQSDVSSRNDATCNE